MVDITDYVDIEQLQALRQEAGEENLNPIFLAHVERGRMMGIELPVPESEYYFNKPFTRHRFDFAYPDAHLAIELEGGVFTNGRHVQGVGYTNDCIKYNLAVMQGWRILRYTAEMMDNDPNGMLVQIRTALSL